jgi:opacity protein-like surface antigen
MKKLSILCLMIAASIFMATSVYAAGSKVGQGSSEAFGQLTFSNKTTKPDTGDSKTTIKSAIYTIGYGYFLTDQIQLGVAHMGSLFKISEDSSSSDGELSIYGIDAFAKYHFMTKGATLVPYLGIQGGWIRSKMSISTDGGGGDTSANAFSYGAMGGLKYFVSDNVSINTELNYRHYDLKFDDYKMKTDDISVLIGFSVYF